MVSFMESVCTSDVDVLVKKIHQVVLSFDYDLLPCHLPLFPSLVPLCSPSKLGKGTTFSPFLALV